MLLLPSPSRLFLAQRVVGGRGISFMVVVSFSVKAFLHLPRLPVTKLLLSVLIPTSLSTSVLVIYIKISVLSTFCTAYRPLSSSSLLLNQRTVQLLYLTTIILKPCAQIIVHLIPLLQLTQMLFPHFPQPSTQIQLACFQLLIICFQSLVV